MVSKMLRHKHFIIFIYLSPLLETNLLHIPPGSKIMSKFDSQTTNCES